MSVVGDNRPATVVDGLVCEACAMPGMLTWLRERLPEGSFLLCFSAAEERPNGVLALHNEFLRGIVARRYGDELRRYAASTGIARVELVVDPRLAPTHDDGDDLAYDDGYDLPPLPAPSPLRELPPGLTTRLFAERGFWLMPALAPGQVRDLVDLRGPLRVEAVRRARAAPTRRPCWPGCSRSGATGRATSPSSSAASVASRPSSA